MFLLIGAVMAQTPFQLANAVLLESTQVPGVRAEWGVTGCNLSVKVYNDTTTPIQVDWVRSVYTPEGSASVALVPGTSSKLSASINIPPMMIPPNSYAQEIVFRKDRLPSSTEVGCLFDTPSTGTVMLAIDQSWYSQKFSFEVDKSALEAAEKARRDAEYAAARAACARKYSALDDRIQKTRTWSYILGGAGVGLGAIGAISSFSGMAQGEPDSEFGLLPATILIAGGLGAYIPMTIHANKLEYYGVQGCSR